MNSAPLIITLLIITAVLVQAAAFFVAFRIKRRSGAKEDNIPTQKPPEE